MRPGTSPAQAAEALGIPVVSGNVSLYNETDGRAIPPTAVVGCVGIVEDVREVPSRWDAGDALLVAEAGDSLQEQAALIGFVWWASPLLTLAHDVGEGGLERAVAEAEAWSGREAWAEGTAPYGSVLLACSPEDFAQLGWPNIRLVGAVL